MGIDDNNGLADIQLVAFDVDGVMTDGTVTYSDADGEAKHFNIKDGLGLKLLQRGGITTAIITGRVSTSVARRAAELSVDCVLQGREDKLTALEEVARSQGLTLSQCAYMGDDLPDLAAIEAAALGACPADAMAEILESADWVASRSGGHGAVREFCEFLLRATGAWDDIIDDYRS